MTFNIIWPFRCRGITPGVKRWVLLVAGLLPSIHHGQQPQEKSATTLGAASTVAYTNSMDVLNDRRRLGIGDRLSFRVVEDRKEPVALVVTDSGEVEVPLIGRVMATNKTCKQLAYAIKGPMEKTYFYKATVIVGLDLASVKSQGRIFVNGQVKNQGAQDLPSGESFTLSKAIMQAGGLADFANKKKIKLLRKTESGQTETIVNLEEIMDKGRLDQDPVLKPNDMIVVPQRLVNF
jgi:protein involved in polysaccharide export with SLBB domain